jgi:uncharacterized membrane protein
MDERETNFQAENGMTSARAWEWVLQWSQEGKIDQAIKGCDEILRFFPEREEVRHFYEKLHEAKAEKEESGKEVKVEAPKKIPLQGLRNFLVSKKRKFDEMNQPDPQNPNQPQTQVSEEDRIAGAFCYAYILVLIPLFLKRNSDFVQFHAWQGLVLSIGTWVVNVLFGSVFWQMGVPFVMVMINMGVVFVFVLSAFSAYSGKRTKLPVVNDLSQRIRKIFDVN